MSDADGFLPKFQSWMHIYKVPIGIGIIGLSILIYAVLTIQNLTYKQEPIEFIEQNVLGESGEQMTAVVDIEGEVVKPGVYDVPIDARIDDAIEIAGGLTEHADLEYVTKKLNRAARVVDGGKIYIPEMDSANTSHNQSSATSNPEDTHDSAQQSQADNSISDLISINDANISQLDTLPGIGPVTAQKIIDNRPYQTLEELVSKKAVGQSVYGKIIDKISL